MRGFKGLWLRGKTYWFRCMRNGELRYWNLHTSDLAEAVTRASAHLRDLDLEPTDLLRRELNFALQKENRGSARGKTLRGQESVAKLFSEWAGEISAAAITRDHADRWFAQLAEDGKAPATLHSYARTMRSLFSVLIEKKRLPSNFPNPFRRPALPKLARSPRRDFVTIATRDKLIAEATDQDMKMILLLGFHAGLRKMEICEARPEWVDLTLGVLHVSQTETFKPKDSEDRTIPLSRELRAYLAKHRPSPFLVAPKIPHGKWEYRYDWRLPFQRHVAACGHPEVTAHTMRRTFASLLVNSGVSIYKVAKWLGDDVKVVSDSYGHLVAYDSEIDLPAAGGQPLRRTRSTAASRSRRS